MHMSRSGHGRGAKGHADSRAAVVVVVVGRCSAAKCVTQEPRPYCLFCCVPFLLLASCDNINFAIFATFSSFTAAGLSVDPRFLSRLVAWYYYTAQ